jgi:hypothetical protein
MGVPHTGNRPSALPASRPRTTARRCRATGTASPSTPHDGPHEPAARGPSSQAGGPPSSNCRSMCIASVTDRCRTTDRDPGSTTDRG